MRPIAAIVLLWSSTLPSNRASDPSYPGTADASFWAFQPVTAPPPPNVRDTSWPARNLDRFILARLEEKRLRPASPAAPETLLRRITFDLTGLPPTPDEIRSFLADPSPTAWSNTVERLLNSRQFGERWGRHWLDVARYADSNGLEVNSPFPNAWRYRDYVIDAFNRDLPYDQFIREQLAGDLLAAEDSQDRERLLIATGFLVLGPKVLFEPNREKLIMDTVDEQIDVTSRAFLGITASCARCHDHKFDPISSRDYYALAGIFRSTTTLTVEGAMPAGPNPRRWNERPIGPPDVAVKAEKHAAKIAATEAALNEAVQRRTMLPGGVGSTDLMGVIVDNLQAELEGMWKESTYAERFVDRNYIHDANSAKGMRLARFRPNLPEAGMFEVRVAYPPRDNRASNVVVRIHAQDGEHTRTLDQRIEPPIRGLFAPIGVFPFEAGTNAVVTISNEGTTGFVVIDAVQFVRAPDTMMASATMMASTTMKPATAEVPAVEPEIRELEEQLLELRNNAPPPMPMAMAVSDGPVADAAINLRGDPDKLGDVVPRGFLRFLEDSPPALPDDESGRLELANWIASPRNPLTARVAVNRIWLHLFGKPIVDPPDNFGRLTPPPAHRELLDHLAVRFVELGWSVKSLIREIVQSRAYQMSSAHDPLALLVDPDNTLCWRMNRKRLEVEAMRDAMLAISGRLDLEPGEAVLDNETPPALLAARPGNEVIESRKRTIYLPVLRNNLPDLYRSFDFAEPHFASGIRFATTTPTQALFMMNSPFILQQSEAWAGRLITDHTGDRQRIEQAVFAALGRPATPGELERAAQFVAAFEREARAQNLDDPRRQAWNAFCHSLLASTEFRYLD